MKEIYSAQQQPLYIAHSEEESKEKEEKEMQVGGAKIAPTDQEEKDVGDGFGGNLDGAENARDDEDEEGESNQGGDGFGSNLDGADQDARDDLDEDFRDDPNFSIDVEQLLSKWEEEEKHEAKKRRKK
ncbi:hypothetical protein WN943_018337 [Citrus x changshan-huyou]